MILIYIDIYILILQCIHANALKTCKGKLFHVEDVQTDRIRIDHVWYKPDADNLLLYK